MSDNTSLAKLVTGSNNASLVYYSQEDPRWESIMFSSHGDTSQTIGTSGCGPTSMAMAISTLTGSKTLPPEMCAYAVKNGFRTYNNGIDHRFIYSAAKSFGLKHETTTEILRVVDWLEHRCGVVICALGPGHFTGGGHFIVLYDVEVVGDEAFIHVMDSNHDNRRYWKKNDGAIVEVNKRDDGFVMAKSHVIHKENRLKTYYLLSV